MHVFIKEIMKLIFTEINKSGREAEIIHTNQAIFRYFVGTRFIGIGYSSVLPTKDAGSFINICEVIISICFTYTAAYTAIITLCVLQFISYNTIGLLIALGS